MNGGSALICPQRGVKPGNGGRLHAVQSTRLLLVVPLAGLALLLSACNTPQPKPPPAPKPITSQPLPPPPPPAAQSSEATESGAAPQQEYLPPSNNAAEVEIEERASDGGELPPEEQEQARAAGASGGSRSVAAGNADERRPPAGGEPPVLSAGGNASQSGLVGPDIQLGAQTDEERLTALDAKLNQQLNDFDERMRRARTAAEAERSRGGGSAAGAVGGRGGRAPEVAAKRGAGGAAAEGTGLGNTPDLSGNTSGAENQARYAPPSGVADGKDDDIVARQLREAASQESDPVLREKLWDEYRNYKAGL